jgi:hypothetical protein
MGFSSRVPGGEGDVQHRGGGPRVVEEEFEEVSLAEEEKQSG